MILDIAFLICLISEVSLALLIMQSSSHTSWLAKPLPLCPLLLLSRLIGIAGRFLDFGSLVVRVQAPVVLP